MIKLSRYTLALFALASTLVFSCKKDSNSNTPPATVVKQWSIPLSATFENPIPAGRSETGNADLTLYDNNTLSYHIMISNLAASDALTLAHIHAGDAITSGPVILNLNPTFANGMATGTVDVPRTSLVDSIKNGSVYVNVHSTQFPAGLLRGQMDKTIDFAMDVALSSANEVPAGTSTSAATGIATLRLTSDKVLLYKIVVNNLEANDTITVAHIHDGAAGVNAGVKVPLAASLADFGVVKSVTLDDANFTLVKTGAAYVNVHSKRKGGGLIRGQIR
jgi:hypothetical protein